MTDKKKPEVDSLPPKITKDEEEKVKGGRMMQGSEQCKETSDTGAMGCPG
jgi:hypothetical protein